MANWHLALNNIIWLPALKAFAIPTQVKEYITSACPRFPSSPPFLKQ